MKKWFEYPDGTREDIDKVLAGESKKAAQFAPITLYRLIGKDRPWSGKPTIGVTSALNGTRHEFLKRVFDYAVNPKDTIWMVLGITGHANLEEGEGVEQFIEHQGIRGRSDLVETVKDENGKDFNILTDYKVVGSYAVVKALGVRQDGTEPVFDDNGDPVLYQRSGKWGAAGTQKQKPKYVMNLSQGEVKKYAMQTNMYRIMFEQERGIPIHEMRIFFIVRDGGTQAAKQRGVTENSYYIPMPRYADEDVLPLFEAKRDALFQAMRESEEIRAKYEAGELSARDFISEAVRLEVMPEYCDSEEAWDGRRCTGGYCPVATYCQQVGDAPYFKKEDKW